MLLEKIRGVLPSLLTDGEVPPPDSTIYARLTSPANHAEFYVARGSQRGERFFVSGYLVNKPSVQFPMRVEVSLAELERGNWLGQAPASEDKTFTMKGWLSIYNHLFPRAVSDTSPRRNGPYDDPSFT